MVTGVELHCELDQITVNLCHVAECDLIELHVTNDQLHHEFRF